MDISLLREIGSDLRKEFLSYAASSPEMRTLTGVGAAGDKTFRLDSRAEEIIISCLQETGEPFTLISEEAGFLNLHGGGIRVVIDPIDGSKNAVSGIPYFCSSIAVADNDRLDDVYLAYIINLSSGDEFWAERGKGAFLNNARISAQQQTALSLVAYEAQIPRRDIPPILPLLSESNKSRCFGSIALDLALVSRGAVSVFISPADSRSFDFAAGWLLVKEAGGIISNTRGEEIGHVLLGLKRSTPLLAAGNASLHQKALSLLGPGTIHG